MVTSYWIIWLFEDVSKFWFLTVDGGFRAVIFDRFSGIKKYVVGEGTHFYIPWVQKPIMFDIRARPRNVPVITASKGNWEWRPMTLVKMSSKFVVRYIFRFAKCEYYLENTVSASARSTSTNLYYLRNRLRRKSITVYNDRSIESCCGMYSCTNLSSKFLGLKYHKWVGKIWKYICILSCRPNLMLVNWSPRESLSPTKWANI